MEGSSNGRYLSLMGGYLEISGIKLHPTTRGLVRDRIEQIISMNGKTSPPEVLEAIVDTARELADINIIPLDTALRSLASVTGNSYKEVKLQLRYFPMFPGGGE